MVGIWGGVGRREMIAALVNESTCWAQVSIAPKDSKKEQSDKMNDVKVAVLGGEGTGKSGEWFCVLWHRAECKTSDKYVDLIGHYSYIIMYIIFH